MNIRQIADFSPNYFEINREERNYAAIFFTTLCLPGNIERFLNRFDLNGKISNDFGIYFEYSYLRDLWNRISDEDIKKNILKNKLEINEVDEILKQSAYEINAKFGVAGKPSNKYIQFPGNWSISKYDKNFIDNSDFIKICKFKWSFNIKPDIVIHLDKDHAICIEAKYEAVEGSYPVSLAEKKIFSNRGLGYVGQMELQKYMMENLLGINTKFIFLVFKKESSKTHKVISWEEAFGSVDIQSLPQFAKNMVFKISNQAGA